MFFYIYFKNRSKPPYKLQATARMMGMRRQNQDTYG